MTTQTDSGAPRTFVGARLPWIVAALAAVVYLLTINPWLSFRNDEGFQPIVRATHQAWYAETTMPVFTVVTSPFRWLPETWVPLALNIFSAICAAITLGLLARSVALLPQDRTQKQREREKSPFGILSVPTAWIPPLLAAAVCGLQLTFWENATNVSGDIFDLLLFAYSVRCFLEYRISGRESWLLRAAVVYALGMTDTWVMIALAPGFIAAMIWFRGIGFFQLRFLARLFLCALVGWLLYLYLPLLHLRAVGSFWGPLRENFKAEFDPIVYVWRYQPHFVQFLLAFTSLLPILVISIRWKSHFGDSSQLGATLAIWIFHLTYAVLLGVCIWAAFDTGFSLRDAAGKYAFLDYHRDRLLPLYFLGALSVGYLSGYFLLVFKPVSLGVRGVTTAHKVLNRASIGVICALLVLVPINLLYKNLPPLKITNGPAWQHYASALTENLPSHAVILSDRGDVLLAAQAWLARNGKAANYVFVNTHSFAYSEYNRFQHARYPDIWPTVTTNASGAPVNLGFRGQIGLLVTLSQKDPIYYLHPSGGMYFEVFYPIPHGLAYELAEYPTNTMAAAPPLTETAFAENENFWKTQGPMFRQLLPAVAPPKPTKEPTFRQLWMYRMHIPSEKNQNAVQLGQIYSLALNTLGVQDQKLGRLEAAGNHFAEAQQFNPDNVVAAMNLDFNQKLRAGDRIVAQTPQAFEERFGKFSGWEPTLNANGLFDEATGCLAQGIVFAKDSLIRQAAQQFQRALALTPDSPLAHLWLARIYLRTRTPENAFPLIQYLKAHNDSLSDAQITPGDVFSLELTADYTTRKEDAAKDLLKETWSSIPVDTNLLDIALQVSIATHRYTNALDVVDKQLALHPNDSKTRVNKGYLYLQLGQFERSIGELSQVLASEPTNYPALADRGLAYMSVEKLDEARHDYETLQRLNPNSYFVYYNLGEIAFRKKDTNNAIAYYEQYLKIAPPNTAEAKFVSDRLKTLNGHSP